MAKEQNHQAAASGIKKSDFPRLMVAGSKESGDVRLVGNITRVTLCRGAFTAVFGAVCYHFRPLLRPGICYFAELEAFPNLLAASLGGLLVVQAWIAPRILIFFCLNHSTGQHRAQYVSHSTAVGEDPAVHSRYPSIHGELTIRLFNRANLSIFSALLGIVHRLMRPGLAQFLRHA